MGDETGTNLEESANLDILVRVNTKIHLNNIVQEV